MHRENPPIEPTEFIYKGGRISYSNGSLVLQNLKEIPEFVYEYPVISITIDNSSGIDLRPFTKIGALEIVHGAESLKIPHTVHTISLRKIAYVPRCILQAKTVKRIYLFYCPGINPTKDDPERLNINLTRLGKMGLEYLNIWNSNIAELPESVNELKSLISLQMQNNGISEISTGLYELPHLERLNLSHNKIKKLPPGISNLTRLRYLNINDNLLEDVPPEISEMKEIRNILFYNNPIEEIPPMTCLPLYSEIHLAGTKIKHPIFWKKNNWIKYYYIILPNELEDEIKIAPRLAGSDFKNIFTQDQWAQFWLTKK